MYSGNIKRAARVINETITPANLSSFEDVDQISERVRHNFTAMGTFNSMRCALRAYVSMLNSNFENRFPEFSAPASPAASDLDFKHQPERIPQEVYRFIRDTVACREIKALYEYQCQICGVALKLAPERFYAEAHHIRPLGGEHRGPDTKENLICVCPNHHAQLDYFAIRLDLDALKYSKHEIDPDFVGYHNSKVKA